MAFWVYMLRSADGAYCTGLCETPNAPMASVEHLAAARSGEAEPAPLSLVYMQAFAGLDQARAVEQRIKGWRRARKQALAEGSFELRPELLRTAAGQGCAAAGDDAQSHAQRDLHWMQHALALADRAEREDDEIPVGAVLVGADGALIGEGSNRNIASHDPSAHAEIVALRAGGAQLASHRLPGTTLYVTLEPCAMCAMALVHARIDRLVFAAFDPKTGACGSVFDLLADPRHNHRIEVSSGLLAEQASQQLSHYFRRKRGKSSI